MDTPRSCDHTPRRVPETRTATGEPIDLTPLMNLLAATADECEACQGRYAEAVLDEPLQVAHAAGMAFLALKFMLQSVASRLGAAPPGVIAGAGVLSEATQAVFTAMEADDPVRAEALVRGMRREERSELLADALDTLASIAGIMRS